MLNFLNAPEIAALAMIVAQSCNFQWPLGLTWI